MTINVTKSYLPPIEEYEELLQKIWDNSVLTNQGPLLTQLEQKLVKFLNVDKLQFVTNGTIALQIALEALDIKEGEVITTPFSYVATTSAILWQRCKPVFVDIESSNFTIDVKKIENAITSKTKAIIPVHVFGYACNTEEIEKIAKKYNLKVIYDAAHAFGSKYKSKSLVSFGDISCVSFHATKLFHTIEGGACITADDKLYKQIDLIKRFGHNQNAHITLGINGKQSEFNAAMGLVNLKHIEYIIKERKRVSELYDTLLSGYVDRPKLQKDLDYNYSYFPILFKDEKELLRTFDILKENDIFPRRYFYPSLNRLPYLANKEKCPISENICSRIACLPLYPSLTNQDVERISKIIIDTVK